MAKEDVAVAIGRLETWGHAVDNWVLYCAIGVAFFLALEVVFSVLHWRNENKLRPLRAEQSRLYDEEMAKLGKETEQLRNENIRLQKQLGPRQINPMAFAASLSGAPQEPVEILYVKEGADTYWLASQLWSAFFGAHSKVERPIPVPEPVRSPFSSSMSVMDAYTFGPGPVTILTFEHSTAFKAVWRACAQIPGGCTAHIGNGKPDEHGPPAMPPKGVIRIVVGPKP